MTGRHQLRSLGISAEAYEDLVIIETERSFMSLTPRETERFHEFLKSAYASAQRSARAKTRGKVRA